MLSIIKSIPRNISIVSNGAYILRKIIPSPVNWTVKYFTKKTAIRKRLGIPEPPKKPPNAFMRFVQETKSSTTSTNQCEILKKASNQWTNLSENEKQIYYEGYKKSLNQYLLAIEEYKKSIDQDKLMAIEEAIKQQLELRSLKIEKRNYGNMLHELGKPKRAVTAYFLFRLDCLKTGVRDPHIKEKWATLDEIARKKYSDESAKRQEIFNRQLIQWEAKMVAQGRGHLVRKNTIEKRKIKEWEINGIIKKK